MSKRGMLLSATMAVVLLATVAVVSPVAADSQVSSRARAAAPREAALACSWSTSGNARFTYEDALAVWPWENESVSMSFSACINGSYSWGTRLTKTVGGTMGYNTSPQTVSSFWVNAWFNDGLAYPRVDLYQRSGTWYWSCRDGGGGLRFEGCNFF